MIEDCSLAVVKVSCMDLALGPWAQMHRQTREMIEEEVNTTPFHDSLKYLYFYLIYFTMKHRTISFWPTKWDS
jgi:hypothetical protein